MDLAKAKNIIIAMLLVFNIFLLFSNMAYFKAQHVSKETIANTVAILNARGVTLEVSIPTNKRGTHRLKYNSQKLERSEIAETLLGASYRSAQNGIMFEEGEKKLEFSNDTHFVFTDDKPAAAVNVDSVDAVERAARKYLKENGLLRGRYDVDDIKRSQGGSMVVSFIESYSGFLVYDNYCTVTVSSKGITRLEYGKRQINGFSPEVIEDLAAAYQVLLAYFKEGSSQVITQIDLGYQYSEENLMAGVESIELLPVWRVKIKNAPEPLYLSMRDAGEDAHQ